MSGRRLVVLVALTSAGAVVYGLTGALIGYVAGMVLGSLLPEKACRVPQPPAEEEPARGDGVG